LFIASKIEEIYPPKLSEFAYVTDGACCEEEILTMELVVLKELNWGLAPMTANAWVKMFMQISNCDSRPDNETFVIPQFSGLPFARVMQLLDLVILDIGSFSYRYSVLAASAMCHLQSKEIAMATSGYTWSEISDCVSWMVPFAKALKEDSPQPQIKTFHSVAIEDQHNIQTHTVELTTLDKAQDMISVAKSCSSPEPQVAPVTNTIVDMTPPEIEGDVRYAAAGSSLKPLPTSQTTVLVPMTNSVFLSPQSPTGTGNVPREGRKIFSNHFASF
jgi:G1/S-specific cyclin-E1